MQKKNTTDRLGESIMSLGDHLEELRTRLILAIAGIALGAIVGLIFGSMIIKFIEQPYLDVMNDMSIKAAAKAEGESKGVGEENEVAAGENKAEPTVEVRYIKAPLQTLAPAEGFVSYVKISMVTGLLLSSPWVFYHVWMFVAAGLYPREKKYVYVAAPFSALLFVAGALFFITIVAPLTMSFLINFNEKFLGVQSNFTFQNYISFVTRLMLVFGIAFQTPTAIFFLNRTGLVSLEAFQRSRKYIILVIVIVSAMATPPDVVSQISLAIPLWLLFELGIILSWIAEKRSKA
jgi:sec-independent protein translocase protein TatC